MLTSIDPAPVPAQKLAVDERGTGSLERPRRTAVLVESRLEKRLFLRRLRGEQSLAVCNPRPRPGDLGRGRERRKLIQPRPRLLLLVRPDGRFDAVERSENGDDWMLDLLELRERLCHVAD